MIKPKTQIIVNEKGRAVSVVVSVGDYRKLLSLLEDVLDNRYIASHRNDPKRPFSEFVKNLEKGLV